jgi:superfamily I DNA/RNA helicase
MRKELRAAVTPEAGTAVVGRVFEFLDAAALKRAYPEHGDGDSIEIVIEAFALHMKASAAASGHWTRCLDLFEGSDSTPLMTVHKSKGLEYDTIIFLGLDDNSWWSRQAGDVEGLSTFFVALSRAMQRAIFTYCEGRGRERVADLYQLLTDAGVPEVTH